MHAMRRISVQYQCGATTAENNTYFASPTTPQRICNLMIDRANNEICQVMRGVYELKLKFTYKLLLYRFDSTLSPSKLRPRTPRASA